MMAERKGINRESGKQNKTEERQAGSEVSQV